MHQNHPPGCSNEHFLQQKNLGINLGAIKVGSSDFLLCFPLLWFCVFTGNFYICYFTRVPSPGMLMN